MFWDKIAGVYDLFENVYNGKVNNELCREVAELISADDDVLECACGTGMLTVHVAPKCKRITATDFSRKMLERAAKKCRNYANSSFVFADIMQLDYLDGRFDKVIAANVLFSSPSPTVEFSPLIIRR